MSAVLQERYDPTAGMELTTGDEIALEATRHIFLAGDMIDPHRKDDLPHLAHGGEELANFCLRRTNGYLPRCTITPMEVWAEWLPMEYFPEGVRPLKLKGEQIVDNNPTGRTLINKPLFGYAHMPGELIIDAIGLATGERKGIVEIEALRGVDASDPEVTRIQNLFFGPDFPLPIELRLIEQRIALILAAHNDPDVKSVARDMLTSCEQFRRWAEGEIGKMNTQLDQRVSHQWTYSYSPKVRMLLKQLEVEPRGTSTYNPVDSLLTAMKSQGVSAEVFEQMAERDANLIEKLTGAFTTALADAMKSSQPKPAE